MLDSVTTGFNIDRRQHRLSCERSAKFYDKAAVLQRQASDLMLQRLDLVRLSPTRVLDAGCGTGYLLAKLRRRYRRAEVLGLDYATAMLRQARKRLPWYSRKPLVCADMEALPLADQSVDLILSNMAIQWCHTDAVLSEFRRILRADGLLMFTTIGPDSFHELRQAWAAVDEDTHVNSFSDMHDVGDALVGTGFADPVVDVERYTLVYPEVKGVMRDLKYLGAHNVAVNRKRTLTGKRRFWAFTEAYLAQCPNPREIPATYEVIYGHAWAGANRLTQAGDVVVPFAQPRPR